MMIQGRNDTSHEVEGRKVSPRFSIPCGHHAIIPKPHEKATSQTIPPIDSVPCVSMEYQTSKNMDHRGRSPSRKIEKNPSARYYKTLVKRSEEAGKLFRERGMSE